MGSVLILVLTTAFYASVKCAYISEFGYELITAQIEQLEQNQEIIQQRLENAEQQISTLQAQLEKQKTKFEKLQREMSEFTDADLSDEEEYQNKNERYDTPKEDIEPSDPTQKTHHIPLTKEAITCQPQLENEDLNKPLSESVLLSIDHQWVPWASDTEIPDQAVLAGDSMYVARVSLNNGGTIIGKAYPYYKKCYILSRGKEFEYDQCEVLTGTGFSWVPYSGAGGALPDNAFPGGRNSNGDQQYIGRVRYYDAGLDRVEPASGTIDGRCKILSISFGGQEHQYDEFDVLVVNTTRPISIVLQ